MNKRLSIVVPIYNVEKYLASCIDSLVNQNIDNYEIILVNDGSTDNSQKIIDEYALKYPEIIKPLIKENGGLSDARNYGLDRATGKYITFIDSDDYVTDGYYEKMLKKAEDEDLDLVIVDMVYFWEDGSKENFDQRGLNDKVKDEKRALFLSSLSVCNKLFKKEIFDKLNLHFTKGLWYEDIPVTLMYFANLNKIAYLEEPKYMYRQRGGSILDTKYSPKMHDIFTIFEMVNKEFKDKGLFEKYYSELEYLYIEHFLVYGAFRFLRTDHYEELMTKAFAYVKKEFPNYKKNKYIKTFNIKNRLFLFTNNSKTIHFWHWYLTK